MVQSNLERFGEELFRHHIRLRAAVSEPCATERPLALQQAPVRGHERHVHVGARHLPACDVQEVDRGEFVIEDDEDGGLCAVVGRRESGGAIVSVHRATARC